MNKNSNRFLFPAILILALSGCRAEHGPPIESSWMTPPMPETETGKLVAEYVQVFNSGDQTALSAYVRKVATEKGPGGSSLDERVNSQLYFYNQTRGMDVYSVNQTNDHEVSVVARLRLKEQWRQMDFMFEGEPKKLAGIRIAPTDARTDKVSAGKDWSSALDDYLKRQMEVDQFSGVVLITKDDKPIYSKALGYSDRALKTPNTSETRFNYASVGKMFTSVAIGQLIEKNLLSTNDTLAKALPDFKSPSSEKITIADLLSHQSGLPDFFEHIDHFKSVLDSDKPLANFLPALSQLPVNFAPRERFEYSNSNYMVLGAIIERVSNQSYEQYLREYIFAPAGMTSTSLQSASNTAKGYTELDEHGKMTPGKRRDNGFMGAGKGSAAGGGVTTAGDLTRFAKALTSGKLVSQPMVYELLTPRVNVQRPGEQYGYGFIIRTERDSIYCGHSGGFPGVDAQFDFNQQDGTVFVILCNYEAVGEPVARYAEELLSQKR